MSKKVIGMDLGDKKHIVALFAEDGTELETRSVGNTSKQLQKYFSKHPNAVVVMEAGTHSPWISRLLESMGHEVHIGNPRKLRTIWDADDKSDERDARMLGLIYRLEPRFLHPVFHRSEQAQMDLAVIKARAQLVDTRSSLVTHVRCMVKAVGERLPSCSTRYFAKKVREHLPEQLQDALLPILDVIESLNMQISELERRITRLCKSYSETSHLLAIPGVGPITALAFVLTLEDPGRFKKSRQVGAFLGLTPRRDQSGDIDKQLPITKAGNTYLRRLLVNCAQYILGAFGPDCDLRRHGEKIAAHGGKNAKKRAAVAVARRLSVLMHRLWADNSEYVPSFKQQKAA